MPKFIKLFVGEVAATEKKVNDFIAAYEPETEFVEARPHYAGQGQPTEVLVCLQYEAETEITVEADEPVE